MNRPAHLLTNSSLESGAVNRSLRLFSLQELPADLSTCVHYHEKEGNSMPLTSSQWVGISSLIIRNSTALFPSSFSKKGIILSPLLYLFRRFSDVGLVWDQENWWTESSLNIPHSFAFMQIIINMLLLWPCLPNCLCVQVSRFQIQRKSFTQPGWLGA